MGRSRTERARDRVRTRTRRRSIPWATWAAKDRRSPRSARRSATSASGVSRAWRDGEVEQLVPASAAKSTRPTRGSRAPPSPRRTLFSFRFHPLLGRQQPLALCRRWFCFRTHAQLIQHLADEAALFGVHVWNRPVFEIRLLDLALDLDGQCEPIARQALGSKNFDRHDGRDHQNANKEQRRAVPRHLEPACQGGPASRIATATPPTPSGNRGPKATRIRLPRTTADSFHPLPL